MAMELSHESRDAIAGLRIGSVRYLNARPLIAACPEPVVLEHPSALAEQLVGGALDVALVPVFEAIRSPQFPIVDGVAIAADGPVWSVFVAARKGETICDVTLDPASLTSAHLCRLLFARWRSEKPAFHAEPGPPDAARLLIGNQAITFRHEQGEAYDYLDLAEEWKRHTDLPFVFAVWVMRPGLARGERVAEAFREMATLGRAAIPALAQEGAALAGGAFAYRYLTEWIRFDLGPKEKEAIHLYRHLLVEEGFVAPESAPLVFR